MNDAIFINVVEPKVKRAVEEINEAQFQIRDLENKLELEIGILEIRNDTSKIVVDMEHFGRISDGINEALNKIKAGYERLRSMEVVEIRAAEPPGIS